MSFIEPENIGWRLEAKCFKDEFLQDQLKMIRQYGTADPFFPDKGDGAASSAWAKRYCSDCPVRLACLAEAMKSLDYQVIDQYQGIWGGMNKNARIKLKKRTEAKNQLLLRQVKELFPDAADTHIAEQVDGTDEILPPAS